jgi:hypothetical protein
MTGKPGNCKKAEVVVPKEKLELFNEICDKALEMFGVLIEVSKQKLLTLYDETLRQLRKKLNKKATANGKASFIYFLKNVCIDFKEVEQAPAI